MEPPIKDTPNKEHLSIKDKSTRPNSYYTIVSSPDPSHYAEEGLVTFERFLGPAKWRRGGM